MSQESSTKLESTWGRFSLKQAAEKTQTELEKAGIDPEQITLITEDAFKPTRLEDTKAISNIKSGAITGAVFGALIGLSVSLIKTGFASIGLAAIANFQTIHYFAPVIGAIVGAVGMGLILSISGASVVKKNTDLSSDIDRYLITVKGTIEDTTLAQKIIAKQGGEVEQMDRR